MPTSAFTPFLRDGDRLVWRSGAQIVWIEPWGADVLRVRSTVCSKMPEEDWSLLPPSGETPSVAVEIGPKEARLEHGRLAATINTRGRIRFFRDGAEEAFVEEINFRTNYPPSRTFKATGGDLSRATAAFTAWDDERIYGLGQRRHGLLDQKGCVLELSHRNSEISIPFMVSSRGYGFVWNNPGVGRVEFGRTQTRWVADATEAIDYLIVAGDGYPELMGRYADLTGHAPVLPEWAAGFWQCKLRYKTQDELLAVAREHKRRGLPLDIIVIDYFAWSAMGDWRFDETCWPDPEAMVQELEALDVRVMVSIWPTVNPDSENFAALEQQNLLVRTDRGLNSFVKFTDSNAEGTVISGLLDTTHPDARAFLWEKAKANYLRYGIKVWWLDAIEPELGVYDHDNMRYFAGNGASVASLYPLGQQQAFYEGMRAAGETEIVTLGRAGWLGSQRYGAAIWSGDIHSTWDDLRQQVRAGLNIGLSGIPWWTTDIGGFFGGEVESPAFRELLIRWFQYGTFCPLFRLHGWRDSSLTDPESSDPTRGGPNEVWSYGDEAYSIFCDYLFLRERLKPYIMEQMQAAAGKGIPPMRPLFFDFPEDAGAEAIEDQFLFGPDLIVAPILEAGSTRRSVYLPSGIEWENAWTGETHLGGQSIEVDAPLAQIPLFVRAGCELPIRSTGA